MYLCSLLARRGGHGHPDHHRSCHVPNLRRFLFFFPPVHLPSLDFGSRVRGTLPRRLCQRRSLLLSHPLVSPPPLGRRSHPAAAILATPFTRRLTDSLPQIVIQGVRWVTFPGSESNYPYSPEDFRSAAVSRPSPRHMDRIIGTKLD